MGEGMKKLFDIQGTAVPQFLVMFVFVMLGMYTGVLGTDVLSTIALLLAMGGLLFEIGNRIPVFNKWVGGGSMLAMMVPSYMVYRGWIPQPYVDAVANFYDGISFQTMFICFLMAGSLLIIDSKALVRSVTRYIPTILAGVAGAAVFGVIGGVVMGYTPADLICNYVLPIMGGGNGAGAVPMSQIFEQVTGMGKDSYYAKAIAILTFANILCIVFGALLNGLGKQMPKLTGDGSTLMRDTSKTISGDKKAELPKATLKDCGNGFLWVGAIYAAACLIGPVFPKICGAQIHEYAWFVLLLVILNVTGAVPLSVRAGIKTVTDMFTRHWAGVVFAGIGIALTDFAEFVSVINIDTLIICLATVIGAILATALAGYVFGFYPIDAAITAGLCMANRGGGGDVVVLGAANRMELMSYAAISSRIGGAIVLVIASVVFGILY
ncbi:hypothetical protein B5E84_07345 [Lachnoclostridium sp. An14]|uniref:2-hydroxycarboxylate transporter family protein n=1 Tax=Lachnoclostridium sp. An14 TaxID=1965562 RepID=UPI000B37E52D|nr:2-hydroxycarboxylate transporter family protein [Lachnoclostridium sp. An14]OUQ18621.1 hypothetical protein B5E84_07345 [Lachnoclostridium sp. An14]